MTEHALNHRFRRLRAQAAIIREARAEGIDMKNMMPPDDLPNTKEAVDTNSTPCSYLLLLLLLFCCF